MNKVKKKWSEDEGKGMYLKALYLIVIRYAAGFLLGPHWFLLFLWHASGYFSPLSIFWKLKYVFYFLIVKTQNSILHMIYAKWIIFTLSNKVSFLVSFKCGWYDVSSSHWLRLSIKPLFLLLPFLLPENQKWWLELQQPNKSQMPLDLTSLFHWTKDNLYLPLDFLIHGRNNVLRGNCMCKPL